MQLIPQNGVGDWAYASASTGNSFSWGHSLKGRRQESQQGNRELEVSGHTPKSTAQSRPFLFLIAFSCSLQLAALLFLLRFSQPGNFMPDLCPYTDDLVDHTVLCDPTQGLLAHPHLAILLAAVCGRHAALLTVHTGFAAYISQQLLSHPYLSVLPGDRCTAELPNFCSGDVTSHVLQCSFGAFACGAVKKSRTCFYAFLWTTSITKPSFYMQLRWHAVITVSQRIWCEWSLTLHHEGVNAFCALR